MAKQKDHDGDFQGACEGARRDSTNGTRGRPAGRPGRPRGPKKAVYAYPSEHYPFWRRELERVELPWGSFGENLTTEGLREDTVHIGDRLRAGSALLQVTQPRMPCYKLGIRFGRDDIIEQFLASGRSGFYLTVLTEGDVAAGDRLELIPTKEGLPTVSEVVDEVRREE